MIEYKSKWNKRLIAKANRFYPSSKTCSKCWHIHQGLKLSDRTWTCPSCNAHHDGDENACINLFNYKQNTLGTTVNACGGNYFKSNDLSRIVRPKTKMKINSTKSRANSCEAGISCL